MGRDCKRDDEDEIRDCFYALVLHELREIKHKMATKQDLDAKEAVVLAALQKLSDLVNAGGSGGFDTAPEIAVLQQMLDLANAMIAKLQGGTGTTGTPVISSPSSATASVNVPFNFQVVASNSPASYSAFGLPSGLSINTSTGLISGTATNVGVSSVTITATNASGSVTQVMSLTVSVPTAGAPVISSSLVANGSVGVPFSYQTIASNSPTNYTAVGLLAGLSMDANSGLISGTPTVAGVTSIALTATNASGSDTESLALTVQGGTSAGAPVITSTGTAVGQVGTLFTHQITASNSPTSYNVVGLPQGVSFNTVTGVVFGTPLVAGTAAVTVSATNASGTGSAQLLLTVNP